MSKIICAKRKHFFYIFPLMVIMDIDRMEIKFLNGDVYVPRLLRVGNYHQQSSGGVVLTPRNLEGGEITPITPSYICHWRYPVYNLEFKILNEIYPCLLHFHSNYNFSLIIFQSFTGPNLDLRYFKDLWNNSIFFIPTVSSKTS